jgi:hypothetical protein
VAKKKKREKQNNGTTKSRASLSFFLSQKQRTQRKRSTGNASLLCFVVCLWRDFSLSSLSFPCNLLQKKKQRDNDAFFFVFFSVYFGSEEDAERAEKTERG